MTLILRHEVIVFNMLGFEQSEQGIAEQSVVVKVVEAPLQFIKVGVSGSIRDRQYCPRYSRHERIRT